MTSLSAGSITNAKLLWLVENEKQSQEKAGSQGTKRLKAVTGA